MELIFRCQYVEPVGDEARKFPKAIPWAAYANIPVNIDWNLVVLTIVQFLAPQVL